MNPKYLKGMEVICVKDFVSLDGARKLIEGKTYKITEEHEQFDDVRVSGVAGWWGYWHFKHIPAVPESTEKNCRTCLHSERTDGEYPCNSTCEMDLIFNNWQPKKSEPVVHKFHVCQPVRCITDILHPIKFGDVNIIRGINDEHEGHSLSFVAFPDNRSWMSQHFEPAYKLEVGCKVQVVNYNDSWNGTEGVVISEQSDTPDRWEVKNNMGGIIYFYSPHLIVLEPAPKNQTMKEFQKETQELFEKVEGVFHVGLLRKSMERYKKHVEETTGNILDDEGWATFGKVTINKGGNRMKTEEIKDIAKQLGDEYTGYEPDTGIITLKEMGKVTAEKTKVIIQMNDEDWIELLKKKGITKGISTFALTYTSPELTVEIATIEKVKKPKSSKKKE